MKKITAVFTTIIIALTAFVTAEIAIGFKGEDAFAAYKQNIHLNQTADDYDIDKIINDLVNWKKTDVGAVGYLMNNEFLSFAGSTPGDWFPIGLGRYTDGEIPLLDDNYSGYLGVINDYVYKKYQTEDKLDRVKATEWHRISLAISACGGNPLDVANGINLISDGTYDRYILKNGEKLGSLDKQGINGAIWGLIALDSKMYNVPTNACYSRDDIIKKIIQRQCTDGGFALYGKESDVDITAMAVQALSSYYNSEKVFDYNLIFSDNAPVKKTVRQVVDECLNYLSGVQNENGCFESWGMENVESACQVLVALTSLGINPLYDNKFIKNNNNILDAILSFKNPNGDGGFVHSFIYDAQNPSSKPGVSNTMAGEQVLYSLVSLYRRQNGMRKLYDFREEQGEQVKEYIRLLEADINELSLKQNVTKQEVALLYARYKNENIILGDERMYVHNYSSLKLLMDKVGINHDDEDIDYNDPEIGGEELEFFSESDMRAVMALPEILTTRYYAEVKGLLYRLEGSRQYFNDYSSIAVYKIKLDSASNAISLIQKEIDEINFEITDKLHPFDKITAKDFAVIQDLQIRYQNLSDYDKTKITMYEDLIKAYTQAKNLRLALIVSVIMGGVIIVLVIGVGFNCRRRNKKKIARLALPESDE